MRGSLMSARRGTQNAAAIGVALRHLRTKARKIKAAVEKLRAKTERKRKRLTEMKARVEEMESDCARIIKENLRAIEENMDTQLYVDRMVLPFLCGGNPSGSY